MTPPSRIVLCLSLVASSFAQETPKAPVVVEASFYKEKIRPILTKNCVGCHNQQIKQGGLDLTSREGLIHGSESGPVVIAGNPTGSTLYKVVAHTEQPAMPFKGPKLPDEAIALLGKWIDAGFPMDTPSSQLSKNGAASAEAPEVDHWAFRKPVKPAIPAVAGKPAATQNPIDAFVNAELQKRKLQPSPEADPRVLLRRVYLDLTGLPPTPTQLASFLADKSPQAYEKVVDQLLATPQYGERWGRHWLDIWRYSDWYGYRKTDQVRYSQRHIWRWRDWVVESMNANKGYDRMIQEMLAGDEMAPEDPKSLAATGYLVRSWFLFNRNVWLQDAAEYTATSMLGLTMKCARCHTHKYDPIVHTDYYKFRAFFEPYDVRTDRVEGEADILKNGLVRTYDNDLNTPTYRFIRGNEATPEKEKPLTPGLPAFFKADIKIEPVPMPYVTRYPDGRGFVQHDLVIQAEKDIEKGKKDIEKAKADHQKLLSPPPPEEGKEAPKPATEEDLLKAKNKITGAEKHLAYLEANLPAIKARIAADRAVYQPTPSPDAEKLDVESQKLEQKANYLKADEELFHATLRMEEAKANPKKAAAAKARLEAAVKALGEANEGYTPIGKLYPANSTGRRLALAKWITSKDNPLTARVAVNHIWLRHFGKALVPTVFNFGKSGKAPSHPELLDWLAIDFMESGWDMKRLHRLVVTSAAYRMTSASKADSPNLAIDPDNIYLWRMNTRRMEAEAVRDSLLHIAGKLDTTIGGPDIEETKGETVFRRSLYFRHAPDLQVEMLQVFDLANPNECFERTESVMPQQALALSNSGLSYSIARMVAGQLGERLGPNQSDSSNFVKTAFEAIIGRPPSEFELTESSKFLQAQEALYMDKSKLSSFTAKETATVKPSESPALRAKESLVHALLNHNDFVTIR
jgi:hypothetical protein